MKQNDKAGDPEVVDLTAELDFCHIESTDCPESKEEAAT